jgi:hypothetical protein
MYVKYRCFLITPVILSGVSASRSEALTESKDPMPSESSTSAARYSHPALYEAQWESLAAFAAPAAGMGSFDSRASRKREARFAQDDRCWGRLMSMINVFVVVFPKMRFGRRVYCPHVDHLQSPLRCPIASPLTSIAFSARDHFTKTCHPGRSRCRAKRNSYEVEGPHIRVQQHRFCKASLPPLYESRGLRDVGVARHAS